MPQLKDPGKRGDLYARIEIELPTELNDQEKQLYGELQRIYNERGEGGQ
jgi:DnaJ-class molecular chaperone